jgi:hypothetical protein
MAFFYMYSEYPVINTVVTSGQRTTAADMEAEGNEGMNFVVNTRKINYVINDSVCLSIASQWRHKMSWMDHH